MSKIKARWLPMLYGQWLNFLVLFNPRKAAKVAFNIFCTIRKGKVLPAQKPFLDPAKLSVENVDGHLIQTYCWPGSKDTVLLLHGWESNTHRWKIFINRLQKDDFNIVAFDAPAHGYSTGNMLHVPQYAKSVRHVLNKFKPKHVVAHSMGGMTIIYDHFIHPKSSVENIVTIGSPCEFENFIHQYQHLLKFNKRVWNAMDAYLKDWLGYHFKEFSSALFATKLTKKGLIFHDKLDPQVAYTESVRVHEHWKGSELILTEGLGHSMHDALVYDQIVDFINS